MVSKGMENVIKLVRQQMASMTEITVKNIRDGLDLMAKMVKIPKDVKCEPVDAGGVPAEWMSTPGVVNDQVILYLHGGGFIAGSIATHRDLAQRISRVSKARILLIDYRLAPEHPYPAAFEDVLTAYRWLIDAEKISPNKLIIAGDSAGGGLTVGGLIRMRDAGLPLPAAAVCLSPGVDPTGSGESFKTKVDVDPFITPEIFKFMVNNFFGDIDVETPLTSVLLADLSGLPPMLIQVGSSEILLDDSVRLAERAKGAGVDVTLDVWEDMIHVFQAFAGFAPESREAIDKIGEFIQRFFN